MQKATPVLDAVVEGLPEVEDGRFRVTREGAVYRRRKTGGWELAPQNKTARDGKYFSVSYTENGKQTAYTVHRLVAQAYVPNPDNKPEVNHKDGNGHNNSADNLEWATRSENCQHAYRSGLIPSTATAGKPCSICGEVLVLRTDTCPLCTARMRNAGKRLPERTNLALAILDSANERGDVLNDRQIGIMRMLAEGKTYQEIGDYYKISRERVRQIIQQVRIGRYTARVTAQQKSIAEYLRIKGIKRTTLAKATGIEYGRLSRVVNLKCGMDDAECAAILKFLGVDEPPANQHDNIVQFTRMPQGVVRRG